MDCLAFPFVGSFPLVDTAVAALADTWTAVLDMDWTGTAIRLAVGSRLNCRHMDFEHMDYCLAACSRHHNCYLVEIRPPENYKAAPADSLESC